MLAALEQIAHQIDTAPSKTQQQKKAESKVWKLNGKLSKKRVDQMTGDEEWANNTILRGMQARQHFLRNPRYDPQSRNHDTRLTVRPPSPRMIGKDVYVAHRCPCAAPGPRPVLVLASRVVVVCDSLRARRTWYAWISRA